jgi:hypothetical protein
MSPRTIQTEDGDGEIGGQASVPELDSLINNSNRQTGNANWQCKYSPRSTMKSGFISEVASLEGYSLVVLI